MALKLTDIGILIYIVMALYLAAAAAYANRRARASVVLAIISLIALILAGGFHVTARWGELQVWLNISVTWRERGTEDSKVFYCVSIVVFAALALQLAMTALFKAKRLAGTVLFGLGFVVAAFAFVLRWIEVDHVPLQNMFEVFLCLGALMWPIALFCRRFMGVGGEAADAVLGFIVLFPAGFACDANKENLMPALQSPLFFPHVFSYMLSYVILAKAAVPAFQGLFQQRPANDLAALDYEAAANRVARMGFPLLTLGLVLGMWWGKIAWGDYWNWDPKELWSLISWLVYLGYFHFRYMYGLRFKRVNCAWLLAGITAIFLTLIWVSLANIFKGSMHSYAS